MPTLAEIIREGPNLWHEGKAVLSDPHTQALVRAKEAREAQRRRFMRVAAIFVYYVVCIGVLTAALWGERAFLLSMGKEFVVGFGVGTAFTLILILTGVALQKRLGASD